MAATRKSKYDVTIDTTLEAAVDDSLSEFETLGSEMRDWYDNMPENLQDGDKGSQVNESADVLEGIDTSIDVPEVLKELPIKYEERQAKQSRAARRDYAVRLLQEAIDAANTWVEGNEKHEAMDDVEAFLDEAQNALDEAEGVDFPGMMG